MKNNFSVRSKDRFIVFGSPAIEEDEIAEVAASMRSGWIGSGPKVKQFEEAFLAYKQAKYAIAVNSCTAALHLCLIAASLPPGSEVITTAMTFCATINAIIHAGLQPVIADINPDTLNIDLKQVEKMITSKTRAILPVHFAGRPCEMNHLLSICKEHNLILIEDCAHAIESEYKGCKTGTFGDFGCFSFYVTKNLVTGEGGMVLCRDEDKAYKIKILALHGMSADAWRRFSDAGYKHYHVIEAGFKYNMMDLQAAIGIHQLKRIEKNWNRRSEIWNIYNKEFRNLPISLPPVPEPDTRHSYHLYTILVDEQRTGISRDRFLEQMTEKNIGVGVHYLSIPEHPYYQDKFGWRPDDYPNAMRIGRQTVSLPLSAKLTDEDVIYVMEAVHEVLGK